MISIGQDIREDIREDIRDAQDIREDTGENRMGEIWTKDMDKRYGRYWIENIVEIL